MVCRGAHPALTLPVGLVGGGIGGVSRRLPRSHLALWTFAGVGGVSRYLPHSHLVRRTCGYGYRWCVEALASLSPCLMDFRGHRWCVEVLASLLPYLSDLWVQV